MKHIIFEDYKKYIMEIYEGKIPKYNRWIVVDESWFNESSNMDKIVMDCHGYCIIEGNIRVDCIQDDLFKEEREAFNKKWNNGRMDKNI